MYDKLYDQVLVIQASNYANKKKRYSEFTERKSEINKTKIMLKHMMAYK